jgi:hypothetical protein
MHWGWTQLKVQGIACAGMQLKGHDVRDGDRLINCAHDVFQLPEIPPVPRKELGLCVQVPTGPQGLVHVEMVHEARLKLRAVLPSAKANPRRGPDALMLSSSSCGLFDVQQQLEQLVMEWEQA